MKLTLTGRCSSCHAHHPADTMCPPHEMQTTGQSWFPLYVNELETEVERLLTALRFYADANHYPRQLTGEGGFRSPVLIDGGHQAREAIGGK